MQWSSTLREKTDGFDATRSEIDRERKICIKENQKICRKKKTAVLHPFKQVARARAVRKQAAVNVEARALRKPEK
jgi:hypothetical protein